MDKHKTKDSVSIPRILFITLGLLLILNNRAFTSVVFGNLGLAFTLIMATVAHRHNQKDKEK